jgi:hypothetical protein
MGFTFSSLNFRSWLLCIGSVRVNLSWNIETKEFVLFVVLPPEIDRYSGVGQK